MQVLQYRSALSVVNIHQIANLPWYGNYGQDVPCFEAVADFILNRATSVEVACQALYELSVHGMGIHEAVTPAVLADYLQDYEQPPKHYTM